MKKIILSLIILFTFYFIPSIAYGQTPIPTIDVSIVGKISESIPVMSCGVAGDTEGKDKCCYTVFKDQCSNQILDYAKTLLHLIPGTERPDEDGDGVPESIITDAIKKCDKIKEYAIGANNTPCIVGNPTVGGQPATDFSDPSCKCTDVTITNPSQAMIDMCAKYLSANRGEASSCVQCASKNGMWTGMGCLPLDLNTLISSFILSTGIGIGGIFALLCIIYSAFMMQSSQGNPEKLKKAQEMITSCIMGLMLIIFSVLIMKIIGVNILRIPGFG